MPGIPPNALPMLKRVVKGLFKRDKTDKVEQRQGKATVAPPASEQKVSAQPAVPSQKPAEPAAASVGPSTVTTAPTDHKTSHTTQSQAPLGSNAIAPATGAGVGVGAVQAAHPKEDVLDSEVTHKTTDQPAPLAKGSATETAPAIASQPAPLGAHPSNANEALTEDSLESTAPVAAKSGATTDSVPGADGATEKPTTTTSSTTAPTTTTLPAATETEASEKDSSGEGVEKEQAASTEKASAPAPNTNPAHAPGMSATSGPLEDFVAVEGVE